MQMRSPILHLLCSPPGDQLVLWWDPLLSSHHCARAGKTHSAPGPPPRSPGTSWPLPSGRRIGVRTLSLAQQGTSLRVSHRAEGSCRPRVPGDVPLRRPDLGPQPQAAATREYREAGAALQPYRHPSLRGRRPPPTGSREWRPSPSQASVPLCRKPALPPSILLGGRAGTMR